MSAVIMLVNISKNFKFDDIERDIVYNNLEDIELEEKLEVIEDLGYLTKKLKED